MSTRIAKLESRSNAKNQNYVCTIQAGETNDEAIARHIAEGGRVPFMLMPRKMTIEEWLHEAETTRFRGPTM